MADRLKKDILKHLEKKLGIKGSTIRVQLSILKRDYSGLTLNAAAQRYAQKHGISILTKLDEKDKLSLAQVPLPSITQIKSTEKIKVSKNIIKKKDKKVIEFETTDIFIKGHIDEINRAYNSQCYTSVVILARKIIENLIIDILTIYFPPNSKINKELYFDTAMGHSKDFSVILDNFYNKRVDFGIKKPIVEKLYKLAKQLKGDANNKTHSWFHLVNRQKEVDDLELQVIIELIKKLLASSI